MKYFAIFGLSAAAVFFSSGAFAQSSGTQNGSAAMSASVVNAQFADKNPFKSGDFSEARLPDGTIVQRP